MAEKKLDLDRGGKAARAIGKALGRAMPEWQVFVRRPNGTSAHFVFSRRRQLALLGGAAAVTLWAVASSVMLTRQPEVLAAKERELKAEIESYRAAQERLALAQRTVADVTREVDGVQANLRVLADSRVSLATDKAASAKAGQPAGNRPKNAEPAEGDSSQPGAAEARAVREQVRKLEASLERLRSIYEAAVENTAAAVGGRVSEAEKTIARLGLDPDRVIDHKKNSGRGGPFIPAPGADGDEPAAPAVTEAALGTLMQRMERLDGIKGALERLPLGEPLREPYELNSPFGTRHDPINNRNSMHEGLDFGAPVGTPVYATGEGIVASAGPADRYGLMVSVDHGNGVHTRYAHLSKVKVKAGQRVTRSTVVGLLGNTGRSTGPHLHYEVRVADAPRDPLKFIRTGSDAPKIR